MKTFTTSSGTKINVKNGDEVFHSILTGSIEERKQWLAKFRNKFSDAEANIIERSIRENWKLVDLKRISGKYAVAAFKKKAGRDRIKAECAENGMTVEVVSKDEGLKELISHGH